MPSQNLCLVVSSALFLDGERRSVSDLLTIVTLGFVTHQDVCLTGLCVEESFILYLSFVACYRHFYCWFEPVIPYLDLRGFVDFSRVP